MVPEVVMDEVTKEPDAIVVRSPQPTKQKSEAAENVAESSQWPSSPGFPEVANSPVQTPVSGKGRGRGSRISNNGRAGSQTPMSSVGKLTLQSSRSCIKYISRKRTSRKLKMKGYP
ncbi:hypothetical protein Droror1_Dr00011930, partial [Drosera rotundifolia]